ncbi:kinase-like domain-containing protein [Mycena leptocephala]|nr:kinase-like domain-containing protein [Mycena leptocephala]
MTSNFLDLYEALDVIGNGSFGIIRKVRRKTDGLIFARKELNFDRMNERDRKQIVAEVNILKDLHHDHIVRYHDRYVDRDAGVLYILMEYCGGGDLSTVIKQAVKQNRPISEDAVWGYFMQILLALNHCHNTGGHGRTASAGSGSEIDGKERRAQILHRDLKPDNVFLDESNTVKLGDFGLSKALAQTNFANTYVGTPYYMSPELMQEKAYDSKSDMWSLGCLIYELCALKPPFHEAKTHNELSALIRNARIPPLPRGYSQALSSVIKAMLNLNPAMRPSAAQLLQHERLEFAFKVSETEKLLNTIKSHKATLTSKERDLLGRESALNEKESEIMEMIQQRDVQIHLLQSQLVECQSQLHQAQLHMHSQPSMDEIHAAVKHREEELRVLVLRREEEVSRSMQRREDEIMEAVRRREAEVLDAWGKREEVLREEFRAVLNGELEARERMFEEREEEVLLREAAVRL